MIKNDIKYKTKVLFLVRSIRLGRKVVVQCWVGSAAVIAQARVMRRSRSLASLLLSSFLLYTLPYTLLAKSHRLERKWHDRWGPTVFRVTSGLHFPFIVVRYGTIWKECSGPGQASRCTRKKQEFNNFRKHKLTNTRTRLPVAIVFNLRMVLAWLTRQPILLFPTAALAEIFRCDQAATHHHEQTKQNCYGAAWLGEMKRMSSSQVFQRCDLI